MNAGLPLQPLTASKAARDALGRVCAVSGAQISVGLPSAARAGADSTVTVGKFLGILSGSSVIIGMVTEIVEQPGSIGREQAYRSIAHLDLVGEIKSADTSEARFQ